MEGFSEKRIITYIVCGVLVAALMASVSFFLVYKIMYRTVKEEPESEIDVYDVILQDELGINATDYESRPLYTKEMFESDKRRFMQDLEQDRYDLVESYAKEIFANYKFNDDSLSIISALRNATKMDFEEYDKEDRVIWLSNISDIEMYLLLFMKLPYVEQSLNVKYPNVNILPALEYNSMEIIHHESANEYSKNIIGYRPFYEIILKARNKNILIYMTCDKSCEIFYINNDQHNMNGMTYN
jgi:hypothetical protein